MSFAGVFCTVEVLFTSYCISLSIQPLVLYQPLDPTPRAVSASRPNPSCCISLSTQPLVLYQLLNPTPRAVSASRPQPLMLYQPLDPTPRAVSASQPNPSCCISLSTQPLVLYQPLDPTPRAVSASRPNPSCFNFPNSTNNRALTDLGSMIVGSVSVTQSTFVAILVQ